MTTFVFPLGSTIHGDLVTPFFFWAVIEEEIVSSDGGASELLQIQILSRQRFCSVISLSPQPPSIHVVLVHELRPVCKNIDCYRIALVSKQNH